MTQQAVCRGVGTMDGLALALRIHPSRKGSAMDWQGLSRELGRRCSLRAIFFASDTWGRNPQSISQRVIGRKRKTRVKQFYWRWKAFDVEAHSFAEDHI